MLRFAILWGMKRRNPLWTPFAFILLAECSRDGEWEQQILYIPLR